RLLVSYLIFGFVGLGFQQVAYRLTTFVWGPATAQYSFVVGMFLVGLVAGAILVNRAGPQSTRMGTNPASLVWLSTATALMMIASMFVLAAARYFLEPVTTLMQAVATDGAAARLFLLMTHIAGF